MPRLQGAEIADRRAVLVDAAATLFKEKGYERTTVRDIAAAVGMQSGSLFYHFKSKEEILVAVMRAALKQALAEQLAALSVAGTAPREQLRALIRAHLRTLLLGGSNYVPVLLYEWKSLSTHAKTQIIALRDEYEQAWNKVIGALNAAGQVPTSVSLTRLFLFGALNWTAQWYDANLPLDIDGITERALTLFVHTPA